MQVLGLIKARGVQPLAEEKQILDGIKIILENGWIVKQQELLIFFDSLGLKQKASALLDQTQFLEFTYLLSMLFGIDVKAVEEYFEGQ